MIPLWKLKREAIRLGRKANALPWYFRGRLRRWTYDRQRASRLTVTEGAQPARPEMAVLLIYQPAGLIASTFLTLDYFADHGVSTVVVSNTKLTPADRARLAARSHLVIERPNVGYDFGGYREGVMTLLERGGKLDALYVLNDSIWFPLARDSDAMERLRANEADVVGLLMGNAGKPSPDHEYIQSYFFRFSGRLIAHPDFARYWREMPLVDDKYLVVHRFERFVSRHFKQRGFKVSALTHWSELADSLARIEDEATLRAIFTHQSGVAPKDYNAMAARLAAGDSARALRDDLAPRVANHELFASTVHAHPVLLMDMRLAFLKKRIEAQHAELVRFGLLERLDPVIQAEIAAARPEDSEPAESV
ncbi:rhamnan synthesis F family protein [Ancylobacter sp. WKF20]|uniref:rhamnan synthesis F family protein n=1 Tax=Ancylobacter sp. WKF20 TaxID=3039801 RepID=UPI0024343F01|nr:rhamnan synthesis F family protein [Ancylobacter sp. WKF20]WGD28428.1 rhamnan synthesis F family protein [Ancylobacter sp. WKF20]